MSFLLDALRKSQSQRERGSLPDLHSQLAMEPAESARRSPWPWVLIVLLVISAAWAWQSGWLRAPESSPPPSAAVEESSPEIVVPALAQEPAKQPEAVSLPRQGVNEGPRTPLDRFEPPPSSPPPSQVPAQAEQSQSGQLPASETPSRAGSSPEFDARLAVAGTLELDPLPEPVLAQQPAEPERPEAMAFWELPVGVREDLPDFNISVLVYSEDPNGRFVLMNGRLFVEGDKVANDVVLDEIRRDGAVLQYDLYRFLVTR